MGISEKSITDEIARLEKHLKDYLQDTRSEAVSEEYIGSLEASINKAYEELDRFKHWASYLPPKGDNGDTTATTDMPIDKPNEDQSDIANNTFPNMGELGTVVTNMQETFDAQDAQGGVKTIGELLKSPKDLNKFRNKPEEIQREIFDFLIKDDPFVQQGDDEDILQAFQYLKGQAADIPLSEVPSRAAPNILPSAAKLTGEAMRAFTHPQETLEGLVNISAGGIQKLINSDNVHLQEQEKKFDAVADFFKQRYGNTENIKRTIANDPAGFVLDLSSVLGGAGLTFRGLSTAARISRLPKTSEVLKILSAGANEASSFGAGFLSKGEVPRGSRNKIKEALKLGKEGIPTDAKTRLRTNHNMLAEKFLENDFNLGLNDPSVVELTRQITEANNFLDNITVRLELGGVTTKKTEILGSLDNIADRLASNPLAGAEGAQQAAVIRAVKEGMLRSNNTLGAALDAKVNKLTRIKVSKGLNKRSNVRQNVDRSIKNNEQRLAGSLGEADRRRLVRENEVLRDLRGRIGKIGFENINQKQLNTVVDELTREQAVLTPTQVRNVNKLGNLNFKPDITAAVDAAKQVAFDNVRFETMNILRKYDPQIELVNRNQKAWKELREAISDTLNEFESTKRDAINLEGAIVGTGVGSIAFHATGNPYVGTAVGVPATFIASKIISDPRIKIARAKLVYLGNQILAKGGSLNLLTTLPTQARRIAEEGGIEDKSEGPSLRVKDQRRKLLSR